MPLPFVHFQAPVYLKGASLPPCMSAADAAAAAAAALAVTAAALPPCTHWEAGSSQASQVLSHLDGAGSLAASDMLMVVCRRPSTTGPNPF